MRAPVDASSEQCLEGGGNHEFTFFLYRRQQLLDKEGVSLGGFQDSREHLRRNHPAGEPVRCQLSAFPRAQRSEAEGASANPLPK